MPNVIMKSPDLWIGNRDDSLNREWLESKKITCVVNCTPDLIFRPNAGVKLQHRVSVYDAEEDIPKMTRHLPDIVKKITEARRAGHNILVHCRAGQQRSAAVVAAYIMSQTLENGVCWVKPDDAIDFVKKRRSVAFRPKANFRKSLMEYSKSLESKRKQCKKKYNTQYNTQKL